MKSEHFLKEGFVEDASEVHADHEVQMARSDLFHAAEDALVLHKLLRNVSEQQGLEGWVAAKITLASDYLKTVREYIEYELMTAASEQPMLPIAEGSTNDYFKRRKDEEDRIAGTKAPAKRTPQQTDYAKRRAQEKKTEQGVAEAAKWRDPKYQGKTFDYDDSYEGPGDTRAGKVSLDRSGMRQIPGQTFDPLEYKAREKRFTGKLTPQDVKYATAKNFKKEKQQQTDYDRSRKAEQGVAEGSDTQLSIQQLATISDEALDNAYGYGRSSPGNTFGWQANLMSAAYAKKMIDAGVTDIEKISDAIHKGWNVTAQKFVQNPDQFDDTEKLRQAGKLEAKLQQRAKLMKINYAQLDNEEQEKDRVVARALLQAIKNQQGVAEGSSCSKTMEGKSCPMHGLKECPGYKSNIEETTAGSVATVVNPTPKNKAKVGTLFGGTYKQKKTKA